jgi:membrane protein CcdC involved in cytochrome C biogenesis
MNMKKFMQAMLAGSVSMWLLAGLWHEVVMARFYAEHAGASHEGTGIIFLAYFVLGGLMAYLYPLVYREGRPLAEGLKFGILIGILWVFPHDLAMAGAHGDSISYVFRNTAWHMVEQGLGGMIIGLIYGRA